MRAATYRPTEIVVDLAAISENVRRLVEHVAPAQVCAVVKADAYGHGLVPAAHAAVEGGATWLAVAVPDEAYELRDADFASPILLLSEPQPTMWAALLLSDVDVMVYSDEALDAAEGAAKSLDRVARVHLKVDTGMHRVGCPPDDAARLADRIDRSPHLHLAGLATHLATADDPDSLYPAVQLDRYRIAEESISAVAGDSYLRHVANSAAAIVMPAAHYDLVRCGIACYGIAPSPAIASRLELVPALTLRSKVSFVKRLPAGEPVSYGCRYVAEIETTIATLPIGYADGVPRSFGLDGGEVLIGGRRHPVVGTVTMDQTMVDVGDHAVSVGDEVVLIGTQGEDEITANEVGATVGTIGYEIVTRLGGRVPRRYR